MLAKLRRRFVLITMSLVGVVLVAVLASSVMSSYQTQLQQIQRSVQAAVGMNDGDDLRPWLGLGGRDLGNAVARSDVSVSGSAGGSTTENIGGIAPNQPVYLVVIDNSTGIFIEQSTNTIMDTNLLATALERVANAPKDSGFLDDLGLYYQRQTRTGSLFSSTRIAFADTTQLFNSTLQQAGIAVLIGIAALLAFFVISLFLSKIALRPVQEAWEQQRRFVADASHELKTPLTVILANNNIMLAHPEKSTAAQQQWLESTQAEAQRMDSLVRDLLLLAQLEESQDLPAEKNVLQQTVGLSALAQRALLQFDAVFFERNVTIADNISAGVNVKGNQEQLERLLAILLDNASKYSKANDTVDVSLNHKSGQHGALLTVSNNGKPVAPNRIGHIFERFYRGDAAHSDEIEGSGLGLSLAKAIVEACGGTIAVTSTPIEDSEYARTTFTVTI